MIKHNNRYYSKTNKTSQIVISGLFLSLAIIFQLIQIPLYSFLATDLTLGILLISTLFLKTPYYLLIAFITPFFAIFGYIPIDVVGILILESLYFTFLSFYTIFQKKRIRLLFNLLLTSIITIIIVFFLNLLIFYPIYFSFNYSSFFGEQIKFWIYFLSVFAITSLTTIIRVIISTIIFIIFSKMFQNILYKW